MHKYESLVLKALSEKNNLNMGELTSMSGLGKDEVMWALENLKSKGMAIVEYSEKDTIELSDEGKSYVKDGLPEEQLVKHLTGNEVNVADLIDEKSRIGLQWAKKLGLIQISEGTLKLTDAGRKAAQHGIEEGKLLRKLSRGDYDPKNLNEHKDSMLNLVKRKLIQIERSKAIQSVSITKEGMGAPKDISAEVIDHVDRNVIASEAWKTKEFKKYDVNVGMERRVPAMRHPVKRLIEQLKDAYTSMGFHEISGPAVESSFWVFDSLFVPQDHPARDAQDTFYISNLQNATFEDSPHVKTVKKAHEKGWHSKWAQDVAGQMLLRTHTTSVSSRYVYNMVSELSENPDKYDLPIKLFSIGRVFRNEAIDYRHLADFYQHDGIIIGKNLTMSNLFDTLTKIYAALDIKIRFRPSYFPFVEPGTEFSAYSEKTKEWIEMGGAGIIREEITGVKRSKLSVLAWGPGIERILLIKDPSIQSISELYNNDIGWTRNRKGV